jgi:hypothetical protein
VVGYLTAELQIKRSPFLPPFTRTKIETNLLKRNIIN